MLNHLTFSKTTIVILLLAVALPSGACACAGSSPIHDAVQMIFGLVYIFIFPLVLFSVASPINLGGKAFSIYALALIASMFTWAWSAYLILVLPLLPFVAMIVWLKNQKSAVA